MPDTPTITRTQPRTRTRRGPVAAHPTTGTTRRIQALATIGWPYTTIADRTGTTHQRIQCLAEGRVTRTTLATAALVEAVYDQLHQQPGPSAATARRATGRGWATPSQWAGHDIDNPDTQPHRTRRHTVTPWAAAGDWNDDIIDPIAIDRALAGDQRVAARLTTTERIALIHTGHRRGHPISRLAEILHMSATTVLSHLGNTP